MNIEGKAVLVTGANRGIGAALVRAFLNHGIAKVYAAARNVRSLPDFKDPRVVPVQIDITKEADITAAVEKIGVIDILVNNAGTLTRVNVLTASSKDLLADIEVNYLGTLRVIQAFTPMIEKQGGGLIANVSSIVGLAPIPASAAYSASKAALHSATQAIRALLKSKNIQVVGIYPGPIDTDMAKTLPIEKASPADVAEAIVQGILADQEEIFPDPTSKQLSGVFTRNPKGLEEILAKM